MNGWMKEEWSERGGINQFWLPGIGKLSRSSQSEPKLHKYNPVMWSYSLFALNSFISTLFKCSPPWLWFLFLPFWKLIVIFHQPLSYVPYSCHRCQCSQNSFLCSLWLSFSVPTSSLSLFFFFFWWAHLSSNLPSLLSESQICVSGPDLPNTIPELTTL